MTSKTASLLFSTALLAAAARAEAPAKKWTETAQLTYLSANGNTKSATLGAAELFKYAWEKTSLELTASALGASQERVVTAEQYAAAEKVLRKVSDRNYLFERVGWEKNRFSGITNRIDASIGLGREMLKTAKDLLVLELGGGYVNEQRVKSERVDFGSARSYAKYTRTLSETAAFSQDAEHLHSLSDQDDYRLNAESSLVASLTTHVSLKASFLWKKTNLPPPGFSKNDTLTALALIFNY